MSASTPAVAPAPAPAPAPATKKGNVVTDENKPTTLEVKIKTDKKEVVAVESVAVCPPLEVRLVRTEWRKKREAFKPLPLDELKKLVREDDFLVDFYLSYATGTGQSCAEKMKGLITKAGFTCFTHADAAEVDGHLDISTHLHRCKAFVIFVTKTWLEAPECEFEYMIAQQLNMTSSRPVILPLLCEEINFKDYPIMASILPNLPMIDISKKKDPTQGLSYALAVTEFLVSPSLPRPAEWRRQREAVAFMSSELMIPSKQYSEEVLPSGDYMGFYSDMRALNSSRYDGGDRFHFRMALKFDIGDKNNNKDDKQKAINFSGVGEDGVDIFRVEKGSLSKDGDVEIVKKYFGKANWRVKMSGKVKNFVLSGTYALEDAKAPGGYWIMWPMRVYWKYRL